MPYKNELSVAELAQSLSYDPETGVFVWLRDVAKNIKAGSRAGTLKKLRVNKSGVTIRYWYVRLADKEMTGARVAWALGNGEWPRGKIMFHNEDTTDLRLVNLYEANSLPNQYDDHAAYMKDHQQAFPLAWKDSHLRSKFGITLEDYLAMYLAQGGKCAICDRPETQMRHEKVKSLAVDHDHETGTIRELLCTNCNKAIGIFEEDRNLLLSAIRYLDKHKGTSVVALLKEETSP